MTLFIFSKSIVLEKYVSNDCAEEICEILSLKRKITSDIKTPPIGYNLEFEDGSYITVQKGNLILTEENSLKEIEIIEKLGIFLSDELKESNIRFIKNILKTYEQNWEIIIKKEWKNRL